MVDDLEFYHYKTGLRWARRPFSIESNNICRKVTRDLISGTLDHGVVGEAKFETLSQYKGGAWKVSRIIGYDHAPAT